MDPILLSPVDVRSPFPAPPQDQKKAIQRSRELLQALRDNPTMMILNARGGRPFMIPQVALSDIPFFQTTKLFSPTEEKTNACATQILRPKKVASIPVDLEIFPPETVAQFIQFRSGRGLPKQFDPTSLFQLADYVQDHELMDEVIFSRIFSNHPSDYRFLAKALTAGYLKHTPDERRLIQQFIESGRWREVLDDGLIQYWIRDLLDNEDSFSHQFLSQCKSELLSFSPSKSPTYQRLVLKLLTCAQLHFSPEEEKAIHTYIANERWEKLITADLIKHWDKSAIDNNDCYSQLFLAKTKRPEEALYYYKLPVEQGDSLGKAYLGIAFEKEGNMEEALRYYRLATEEGNSLGQFRLGLCLREGIGISINFLGAFNCFYRSAKQGLAAAQCALAKCYEVGIGTKMELVAAALNFRLAADQGHSEAQYRLGRCLVLGLGVPRDEEEGTQYVSLAAAQGNLDAIASLADYNWRIEVNLDEATRLEQIVQRGHKEANHRVTQRIKEFHRE